MTADLNPTTSTLPPQLLSISGVISSMSPAGPSQLLVRICDVSILIVDETQQRLSMREGAWITAHANWSSTAGQWQAHGCSAYSVIDVCFAKENTDQKEGAVKADTSSQPRQTAPTTPPPTEPSPQRLQAASTTSAPPMVARSPSLPAQTQAPRPPHIANQTQRPTTVTANARHSSQSAPSVSVSTASAEQTSRSQSPRRPVIAKKAVIPQGPSAPRIATSRVSTPTTQTNTPSTTKSSFGKQSEQGSLLDATSGTTESRSTNERFSDPYWQNKTNFNPMREVKDLGSDIPF